jgi:hypothetical protein
MSLCLAIASLLSSGLLHSAAAAPALPPAADPTGYKRQMTRVKLADPLATCNDGSPAYFYYRNCTVASTHGEYRRAPLPPGCETCPFAVL